MRYLGGGRVHYRTYVKCFQNEGNFLISSLSGVMVVRDGMCKCRRSLKFYDYPHKPLKPEEYVPGMQILQAEAPVHQKRARAEPPEQAPSVTA